MSLCPPPSPPPFPTPWGYPVLFFSLSLSPLQHASSYPQTPTSRLGLLLIHPLPLLRHSLFFPQSTSFVHGVSLVRLNSSTKTREKERCKQSREDMTGLWRRHKLSSTSSLLLLFLLLPLLSLVLLFQPFNSPRWQRESAAPPPPPNLANSPTLIPKPSQPPGLLGWTILSSELRIDWRTHWSWIQGILPGYSTSPLWSSTENSS